MLNYTNVITEEKSYSGLQMKEIKPIMKLIIIRMVASRLLQSLVRMDKPKKHIVFYGQGLVLDLSIKLNFIPMEGLQG